MKSLTNLTKGIMIIGLCCAFLIGSSALYAGKKGVKVGTLVVKALPETGHNLIIRSSVDVTAVFTGPEGKKEHYIGEMGYKLGIDLSHKTNEELHYAVICAASDYRTGSYALQGKYFGQKASVSLGVGAGVQVLLGGFQKGFTLQPLSLEVDKGEGVSAGLGYLYLQRSHKH